MRKPGQGAGEKYRQLHRLWVRRMRRKLAAAGAVFVSLAAAFSFAAAHLNMVWAWSAGFFAGGVFAVIVSLVYDPPQHIFKWQLGEWGEKATARALRPLRKQGWHVLHDLQTGRGNLDHVVVGPGGVFLLDSKWVVGLAEVTADGIRVRRHEDPHDEYPLLKASRIRRAAADLHHRLRLSGLNQCPWVQAVVVIHGAFPAQEREVDKVVYVDADHLISYLRRQRHQLRPQQVVALLGRVASAYPLATDHDRYASDSVTAA